MQITFHNHQPIKTYTSAQPQLIWLNSRAVHHFVYPDSRNLFRGARKNISLPRSLLPKLYIAGNIYGRKTIRSISFGGAN